MRIGFLSIYSWRPHVEHLQYLAGLAAELGHEAHFLTCDGDLATCYSREMRPRIPGPIHCAACRLGGMRSYASRNVISIGSLVGHSVELNPRSAEWAASSAATLGRFETESELAGPEFLEFIRRLRPAASVGYAAVRRWIDKSRLDAMCLFNGRYEVTRGALEAARDAKVPFVSVERTWYGDGLQMYQGENCLGLGTVDAINSKWRDVPLNQQQAETAARYIALRFTRQNIKEWRAYNTKPTRIAWPAAGGRYRVLLTPGSRNETWSNPGWACGWPSATEGFDAVIQQLGLQPHDLVLRCHPNWAERIGVRDGSRSERHYTEWARKRGIFVIRSKDNASTIDLIEQADAIALSGGSAALEAGILGKQIIAVGPSTYQTAGFQSRAYSAADVTSLRLQSELSQSEQLKSQQYIASRALRYCYTMAHRLAQFVPYVRSISTTQYEYFEGADPNRFVRLVSGGQLEADDPVTATDGADELQVLQAIAERRWAELAANREDTAVRIARNVRRRHVFRPIDSIRNLLPRGDR